MHFWNRVPSVHLSAEVHFHPSNSQDSKLSQRPIRIAYIVYHFGIGGVERCIARLANELDRSRFWPHVICIDRRGRADAWLDVEDVPILELRKRYGNDPRVTWRLARMLREQQIDVVHSHNWGTLAESVVARWWAGVPVHIHAERGMELEAIRASRIRKALRNRLSRWALNRCDAVITVASPIARRLTEEVGFAGDRIRLIPNGVELPELRNPEESRRQIRSRLGIPEDSVVIGSLGRLAAVKDFATALKAFAATKAPPDCLHFVVAGEGPELGRLQDLMVSLQIQSRVHFVGTQRDIAAHLAAFDLYVNSSLSEGMSQAVLEAMAAGLPCVVTDVGVSAALVSGHDPCGVVVPPNAPEAMASAFARLVADPKWRNELGSNARRRHAAEYSSGKMIRAYEELYRHLFYRSQDPAEVDIEDVMDSRGQPTQ